VTNENRMIFQLNNKSNKIFWDSVVKVYKTKTRDLVSASDEHEISIIVNAVKNKYLFLQEKEIRNAIALCCMQVQPPRRLNDFMECLRINLNLI